MKIYWTNNAIQDLSEIKAYIARDSELYAIKFIEKLINGTENLSIFPEMGRIVPEAQDKSIREIIFRPYRIIYKIEQQQVYIVTVINSHRDLSNPKLKKWEIG